MTLIDGDRIVTTHLYDEEYEAYQEEKMSIIDFVNAYSEEGVTTADDVLDKIRAEIAELQKEYKEYGWAYDDALEVIDKYKAESVEV